MTEKETQKDKLFKELAESAVTHEEKLAAARLLVQEDSLTVSSAIKAMLGK
jgi:hypothetical protein